MVRYGKGSSALSGFWLPASNLLLLDLLLLNLLLLNPLLLDPLLLDPLLLDPLLEMLVRFDVMPELLLDHSDSRLLLNFLSILSMYFVANSRALFNDLDIWLELLLELFELPELLELLLELLELPVERLLVKLSDEPLDE